MERYIDDWGGGSNFFPTNSVLFCREINLSYGQGSERMICCDATPGFIPRRDAPCSDYAPRRWNTVTSSPYNTVIIIIASAPRVILMLLCYRDN